MIVLYSQDSLKLEYEILPDSKSYCDIQKKGCVGIVRLHLQAGLVLSRYIDIELTLFKRILETTLETLENPLRR